MTVRVALLGSGIFATNWYLPVLLSSSHVTLHTIWSRSESGVAKVAGVAKEEGQDVVQRHGDDGLQALLEDPDVEAIVMALPITSQTDLIIRCLQAGKHVLSEKPVAKDVKTARALIERYDNEFRPKGLQWRVAENFAHEPILRKTRALLREGSLGPVLYWVERQELGVVRDSMWHATSWRTVPDYQGGFILDGGVHMTALLRIVLPTPPASIIAKAMLHRNHLPPHDLVMGLALPPSSSAVPAHGPEFKADLSVIPVAPGQSSPHGTISLSWANPDLPKDPNQPAAFLDIVCRDGKVSIQQLGSGVTVIVTGAEDSKVKSETFSAQPSGVEVEVNMFADAIRGSDEENLGEPADALWDLAVIEALLTSDGKEINLQQLISGQ